MSLKRILFCFIDIFSADFVPLMTFFLRMLFPRLSRVFFFLSSSLKIFPWLNVEGRGVYRGGEGGVPVYCHLYPALGEGRDST